MFYKFITLLIFILLFGCSPALSTMRPASVLGKGNIQVGTSIGAPIPAGAAADIIVNLENGLTQNIKPILANGDRDNIEAGIAAALYPPIPLTETNLKVGLGYKSEFGLRYTIESLETSYRFQIFGDNKPDGFDVSIGGDINTHFFNQNIYPSTEDFSILDIQRLFVDNIERTDFSLSLLMGGQPNNVFYYWFGPKYMYSKYFIDSPFIEDKTQKGDMIFIGGTIGFGIGYKYLWFLTEFTAMNLKLEAEVLGKPADLGGLIIYPAFGLMSRF